LPVKRQKLSKKEFLVPPVPSPRLARRLAALAACAVPLLAQAQSNCASPNTDGDYILGEAQSEASAMHWSTGLVWKRCIEGMGFSDSGTGQCTGTATPDQWQVWATSYLPKYFSESGSSYPHSAPTDRDFLTSGDWRMAYRSELVSITQSCGDDPKVNRVVFPDTPSSDVWSGSPDADNSSLAWGVYFSYGDTSDGKRYNGNPVRLVRAGQSFAALTSPDAQAGAAGAIVTFSSFTLAASTGTGQAWGGARIAGAGTPQFQVNGMGGWVEQAIVKSGDRIIVRLRAPSTAGDSATATFTLRSGQTTGTDATGSNGGDEATVMVEKTATFTANGPVNGACASVAASATAPSTGLCATGTATSVSGSGGQWAWGCNGSNGGSSTSAAACTAPYASQTLSISASPATITVGGTSAITASSSAGLAVTLAPSGPCTLSGTTATGTAQGTCTITASQAGTGDTGASRYLAATSVPAGITVNLAPITGQCGSASGGTLTSAPSTNLCSAGNASSVAGSGPWSWTCQGINGGGNSATCTASLQTWAVTASASPAQGGTATCSPASVAHGSGATCTATASTGYQFTAWTGACAGQAATCTLANVTQAQDSVAQFTRALVVPEGPQAQKPLGLALQPGTGWQVTQASTQTAASVGAALPAGVTLPHGVVALRLELGTAGSTAQVVLTYPEALPAGAVYYKYGPVVKNGPSRWYPFQGAQISGNTVTLTLKDGAVGDDDLTENSLISDPGGVAVLSTPAPAGAQAIPALGEWALALLAGALGLFSLGALRRRGA
jgi:hypothetical protein